MSNDQCIFGYSDGHRLLASSMRLPDDVISLLTIVTDLVPGTVFGDTEGYWTGIPLPTIGRYALMQTWPAPEMRRPGCVWTHVLLLETELFESIEDLSVLISYLRRPTTATSSTYSKSFEIDISTFLSQPLPISHDRLVDVLDSVYGKKKGPIELENPGELDGLTFALWSQQWPKLRRNFRFQTAASRQSESSLMRFDLSCKISSDRPRNRGLSYQPWIQVAIEDIKSYNYRSLRKFLYYYGTDVKRPRSSFKHLCEIFSLAYFKSEENNYSVAPNIAHWFPDREDAATLKNDLVNGKIFADQQIDILIYVVSKDKGISFPYPSFYGIEHLASLWSANAEKILHFADYCAINQISAYPIISQVISENINAEIFWNNTISNVLRRQLVTLKPELLDSDHLTQVPFDLLNDFIDAVPENNAIGAVFVRRLSLDLDLDPEIVSKILRRFSATALPEVISLANRRGVDYAKIWIRGMVRHPSSLLQPQIMGLVQRTSILYFLLEEFDWDVSLIASFGLKPWIAAIEVAREDLNDDKTDILRTFILVLALHLGEEGSQTIFEREFKYVHDRLIRTQLNSMARSLLMEYLPSAGWLRDWDDGLRLRLAVANAYLKYGLSTESFVKLPNTKKQKILLEEAAEQVYGADRYVHALHNSKLVSMN